MTKEYNYIYSQLVDSNDDIHGIISYSVYKRQKILFIKDFKEKEGVEPKGNDLQPFNEISMSSTQLDFYRSEATVLTEKFLADVLEEDLEEREAFFSTKVHSELTNIKPNHVIDILERSCGFFYICIINRRFILCSLVPIDFAQNGHRTDI